MKYENIVIELLHVSDEDILTLSITSADVKNVDWYTLYPDQQD